MLVHGNGAGYEVELTALDGETIALTTLSAGQLREVGAREIAHCASSGARSLIAFVLGYRIALRRSVTRNDRLALPWTPGVNRPDGRRALDGELQQRAFHPHAREPRGSPGAA